MELVPPFKVKAQYAYTSEYEDDLAFAEGQVITVNEIEDEEWFSGSYDGKSGMFPRNFVAVLENVIAEQDEGSNIKTEHPEPEIATKEDVVQIDKVAESEEEEEQEKTHPIVPIDTEVSKKIDKQAELSGISHDVPSPTMIRRKTLESEISSAPSPIVPAPIFPGKTPNDSYGIKKQFIAAGKSSYIPPIKPRDDSKIQTHIHKETPVSKNIVNESSINEQEINQEEGPKLSLKERIALLQKRQEEEEERERAAFIKKQEKKKKQKEENDKKKEKALSEQGSYVIDGQEIQNDNTISHIWEKEPISELHNEVVDKSSNESDVEDADANVVVKENKEDEDEDEDETSEATEEENAAREKDDKEEDEDDEEEEEEGEEDEDDEDLKRRKLVERMAKISGGRNMFGMMGMSPFGNPNTRTGEKSSKKKKSSVSKESHDHDTDASSVPKAVPILPFANKDALTEGLVKHGKEISTVSEENNLQEDKEEEVDADAHNSSYSRADYLDKVEDSSSISEEDDFTESDIKVSRDEELNLQRTASSSSSTIDPEENLENEQSENSITLNKEPLENQATGYDADLDLSDAKKSGLNNNSNPNFQKELESETIEVADSSSPIKPENVEAGSSKIIQMPIPNSEHEDRSSQAGEPETVPLVPSFIPPIPSSIPPTQAFIPPVPASIPPIPASAPVQPPPIPTSIPPVPSKEPIIPRSKRLSINKSIHDEYVEVPDTESDEIKDNDDVYIDDETYTNSSTLDSMPNRALTFDLDNSKTQKSGNHNPIARSSTIDIVPRRSSEAQLRRTTSIKSNSSQETQAELSMKDLEFEIANVNGNSNWWLRSELPDVLKSKIGSELIFEVDSNTINKRGKRIVQCRDYYVLFYDLSQIVFELEYEQEDPRTTIKLINFFTKEIPIIRKDLLDKYHLRFGSNIVNESLSMLNSKLTEDIVLKVLNNQKDIIKPIGNKSFGVTIYKNNNNSNIARIDEIRSGDILWIKNGKFNVHKGLMGTGKSIAVGEGVPHVSIIAEFDPKKEKFKVIESDPHGTVKKESYKISEFKSGRIRVFRSVGKEYVDW